VADKIAAMADRFRTEIDTGNEETEAKKTNGAGDEILEYAVQYAQDGSYPLNLTKEKRAVRKRAALLRINKGEVFFNRGERMNREEC